MAFFKCKMCGGSLEIQDGMTTGECEYCGTTQTVPSDHDENIRNLFNRANVLRIKAEFDKAEEIYEKILQINPNEAEAYWGIILCKYGVEYVEDPKTLRRIPTCHRTSYEAVTADDDYKNALNNADIAQKIIYENEARAIDEIQKGILAISQKEDPYDVFICYKESDENGKRTQDSVIANDIYYQLTQEGYKVFYAAITLEDKLGSEYEPYIFSALNTSRVMLTLGTKPEYFNAVWVKNEWTRFLDIMKRDRSKMLIPCYRDMDAYELPEEFSHLQAQDMSKIGFINDLIRGIKKVVEKKDKTLESSVENSISNSAPGAAPLLKRIEMFLEDREWERADEFCEQVLNIDPENPFAYLYKLMAALKISKKEQLSNCAEPFDDRNEYKKAIRFADSDLKKELEDDNQAIRERNEINRKNKIYDDACTRMMAAGTEKEFEEVMTLFMEVPGWKEADLKVQEAKEKAETARKEAIYEKAIKTSEKRDSRSLYEAINELKSIREWKDAGDKIEEFTKLYDVVIIKEEEARKENALIAEYSRQYDEKYASLIKDKSDKEKKLKSVNAELMMKKSKTKGPLIVVLSIGILFIVLGVSLFEVDSKFFGNFMLVIGILLACMGIFEITNRISAVMSLSAEKKELENELKKIQEISSTSQFIEEAKKNITS